MASMAGALRAVFDTIRQVNREKASGLREFELKELENIFSLLHLKSVRIDGVDVILPDIQEMHFIFIVCRQFGAVKAAHGAGANDGNLHTSVAQVCSFPVPDFLPSTICSNQPLY